MLGFGGGRKGEEHPGLLPRAVSSSTECDSRCLRGCRPGAPKAAPDQPSTSVFFPPPCCRDLKRDVAKKLEKLEKRTQRAIAELIRKCRAWQGGAPALWVAVQAQGPSSLPLSAVHPGERLKGQEDSLASAVDATAGQEACDSD